MSSPVQYNANELVNDDDRSKKSRGLFSRGFRFKRKKRKSKKPKTESSVSISDVSSVDGEYSTDGGISTTSSHEGLISSASSALTLNSATDITLGTADTEMDAFLEVETLGDIAAQKGDYFQAKNSYEVASNLLGKVLSEDHSHVLRVRKKLVGTLESIKEGSSTMSQESSIIQQNYKRPEFISAPRDGIKKFFSNNTITHEAQNTSGINSEDSYFAESNQSLEAVAVDFRNHKSMGEKALELLSASDALFHYNQMLELLRTIEGVDEEVLTSMGILMNDAQILDILGEIHLVMKNVDAALAAFAESIANRKSIKNSEEGRKFSNDDKLALSATHHKMGRIYESLGNFEEAKKHYKKSIKWKKKNHKDMLKNVFAIESAIHPGGDPGGVLDEDLSSKQCTTYNRIGIQLAKNESYNEALEFFHTSVINLTTSKGDDADIDSMTYNNIGNAYANSIDNPEKPLEYYLMALKSSTTNDPTIRAGTLYNCGIYFNKKGVLDKAKHCFEDALDCLNDLDNETLSVETKFLASNILNNIGNVLCDEGKPKKSLEYYEKALKLKTEVFGEGTDESFGTLCNLGTSMFKQVKLDEAIKYFQQALKIVEAEKGDDLRQANVLNKLGNVYLRKQEYTMAYDYYTDALTIKRRVLQDNCHDEVLLTLTNIAHVFYKQGKWDQAIRTYDTIYKRMIKKSDKKNSGAGKILLDSAYVHYKKGDSDKAGELCGIATAIFDASELPADHKYYIQVQRLRRKTGL